MDSLFSQKVFSKILKFPETLCTISRSGIHIGVNTLSEPVRLLNHGFLSLILSQFEWGGVGWGVPTNFILKHSSFIEFYWKLIKLFSELLIQLY